MTQKETRLQRKEILNEKLSQVYESIMIGATQCFLIRDGMVCRIDSIGGEYDALVIEYAENLELAKRNIFGEDGDLFFMDEHDEKEMLEAMMKEIEAA